MFKSSIDRSEEILNNPPTRSKESLEDFVSGLRLAKRDLKAEFDDPRTRMGDRDATKIAATLAEVEMKLPEAERILEAIRNEMPSEEIVESDGEGLNVQASVEKLAVAVASNTIGMNSWHRMAQGLQTYEENIDPILLPEHKDFPKRAFQERLAELIAMPNAKLAEETKKQFPTDEWIGKDPEPVGGEGDLGYIPSHFEKDQTTQPETESSDGNFENALEKERKFRGINKASSLDKAYEILQDKGLSSEEVSNVMKEILDVTSDGKSDSDSPLEDKSDSKEEDSSPFSSKNEDKEDDKPSFSPFGKEDDEDDKDDKKEDHKFSSKQADGDYPSNSAGRLNENLSEPASTGDGAMLQAEPPKAEDAFEKEIETEANKGQTAPRGPNRRRPKDVPAYSTEKSKLTAAAKLAAMFENMTAEQALQIVKATVEEVDEKDKDFIADSADTDVDSEFEKNQKSKESKAASLTEEVSLDGLFDV